MHASVHVKIAAVGVALAALIVPASAPADAWQRIPATTAPPAARPQPLVEPESFAAFRLDLDAISTALAAAPRETSAAAPVTVSIPAPDGSLSRFAVRESPVVEPGLARAHPGIRTYAGRGVDDPTATIRLDTGPMGFHASVRGEDGPWYVDPQFAGNTARYAVYRRGTLPDSSGGFDEVGVLGPDPREEAQGSSDPAAPAAPAPPLQRRNYRLALVTDPTYAQNSGAAAGLDPSDPDYRQQLNANVTAAKVTLVNRINQVYEADFNVRMVLIDATDELNLNTNALATGPNGPCGVDPCFTASQISTCGSGTLTRNSFVTGMIAGARNYDIGHIGLGTDGGGIAQLGVVGRANKSRGCTGLAKPIGDFFAIDYVAHEMGHEFGGNHTFNGTLGSCSATNRNATGETTVEPGSGITVMAYAGICDQDDLQAHSDPYFSQSSIDEMNAYMDSGPSNLSSVQQVALEGFDGTDSFRLFYAGGLSQTITRGTNYTAAGIKSAIEGTPGWPAGATVTVTGFNGASLDDKGFQVTFGGSLAGQQPTLLYLRSPSGTTGFVGETIAGGPTNEGGRWFTDTGNEHAPQVTTAAAHTIPVQTPFRLAAQGSDDDGDPVTYLWEQNDPGPPLVGTSLVDNHKTTGPLFRTFGTRAVFADPDDTYISPSPGENLATANPTRSFPDAPQVASDNTNAQSGSCPPVVPAGIVPPAVVDCYSEFLPTPQWVGVEGDGILHFRVTMRDNHPGGGAVSHDDTALTLAQGAGPFRVTAPAGATTANAGEPLALTWDVAQTDVLTATPRVRIHLSTNGGKSFPYRLARSTPNDGSATVNLPAGVTTKKGVIRVLAVGNVFFDTTHGLITID